MSRRTGHCVIMRAISNYINKNIIQCVCLDMQLQRSGCPNLWLDGSDEEGNEILNLTEEGKTLPPMTCMFIIPVYVSLLFHTPHQQGAIVAEISAPEPINEDRRDVICNGRLLPPCAYYCVILF